MSDLSSYSAARPTGSRSLDGAFVRLVPLDPAAHGADLYRAGHEGNDEDCAARWRYMSHGPFGSAPRMSDWLDDVAGSSELVTFVIIDGVSNKPQGMASYMRIDEPNGAIEIGSIWFGPQLRRTRAATEAIYLLADHVFSDLGYRRLEWKCNDENVASKVAAVRFGFTFEGVFRQHMIVKGLNRDTAWFAMTDSEWPGIGARFRTWLRDDNFDVDLAQKTSLQAS